MAIGDIAFAAGLEVRDPNTHDLREGAKEINKTRDYIATHQTSGTHDASAINSGVFDEARVPELTAAKVPNLPTSKITSGTFPSSRLPSNLKADGPTPGALARNGSGSAPWYSTWMNSDGQFMRNTSSRRYKKNIRDWSTNLDAVCRLRPVIFDRRGNKTPNNEVGFIAEEVAEVLPAAVVYFDGEIDGLEDRPLIAALVNAVQELAHEVAALKEAKEEVTE